MAVFKFLDRCYERLGVTNFSELKKKYEVFLSPVILLVGFVGDNLTLTRIDQLFDNVLLSLHTLIVGVAIWILYNREKEWKIHRYTKWVNNVMLFSFGGLFSGFFVFYLRSASLSSSWPFIFLLLGLMLATEFRRHYYSGLYARVLLYYVAVLSYFIFLVPVILGEMGVGVFMLSSVVSLLYISILVYAFYASNREKFKDIFNVIWKGVVGIVFLFNFLYLTNIIPPVPLSIKHSGVYQEIVKDGGGYVASYEKTKWYQIFRKRSRNLFWESGEDIYVFSAVFAPTKLSTDIYHAWERKKNGRWVRTDRVMIPISGGRGEGYRGYSMKENLSLGKWRVIVETERGQKLGKINFRLDQKDFVLREEVL